MQFARPHRRVALLAVALTLAGAAVGAVEPLLMKGIFDQLGEGGTLKAAMLWAGTLAGLGVLREVVNGLANWLTWRTRLKVHYALLDATVERLHRLPLQYHRDEGVGAILTRLERGIQGIVGSIGEIVFRLVPSIAYLGFAVVLMSQLDWRLTLVVVLFAPLPAVLAALAAPVQVRRERFLFDRWARIYSRFNEVLGGLVTVRSFVREDYEKRRFLDQVRDANDVVARGVGFDTRVGALQNMAVMLARIAAVAIGGYLVLEGQITVGTVVAFMGYIGGLFGPVQGLTGMYRTLQKATVSVEQVFSIIDAQEHIGDAPDAFDPGRLRGDIALEQVTFGYRSDKPPILNDVGLHVRAGEKVALVGPSGSGKSTLTALVQRFYDPQRGVVRLDGHDVSALQQAAIRRQIGVVFQEPLLFNDTVLNNICYGRPDASMDRIRAAVRAAHAESVIEQLPDGYDTVLGERGARLSVGERQRIAIARVLLKDPPIVILDEATSALDPETTALVQTALHELLDQRTALIIAHRLSTVVHADRIAVLRYGRIVETGTHRQLLRRDGYYSQLVHHQMQGLLPHGMRPTAA